MWKGKRIAWLFDGVVGVVVVGRMWKAFIHLFFRVNYLEIVDSNRRPDCIVLFYLEGSSLYVL